MSGKWGSNAGTAETFGFVAVPSMTGFAAGFYGTILKTTDGDATWTDLSFGMPMTLNSVFFKDENTGYIAGTNAHIAASAILKTTDGGLNWTTLPGISVRDLYSICFTSDTTGIAVGSDGTIFKTTNGGGVVSVKEYRPPVASLNIYPNPSNQLITIETSSLLSNGRLSIINLTGQQLFNRKVSERKMVIDVSCLPPGIYIVRLTSDRTVEVGKFVKE